MRLKNLYLLPLLLLPMLISGCDNSEKTPEPAPTVISNEEAVKGLGGKEPSTTETLPVTTEAPKVAVESPALPGDDPVANDQGPAPEDLPAAPPTLEPAP